MVVRSPGETWGLEHRSGCRKHRKCTWKPPWGFKVRVIRSDMHRNYHHARQKVIYWGEIWSTQEERGYYRLRRARKASGSCIDGQWEETHISKDRKSASVMLMESIGRFVHYLLIIVPSLCCALS